MKKKIGIFTAVAVLATATLGGIAVANGIPDQAAAKVAAAQDRAFHIASEVASEKARGQNPDKTTGLDRAAEVSNSWRFTGAEKPGNGNGNGSGQGKGLGRGHANAVHAALAAGISPSTLDSHGEAVSAAAKEMAGAFKGMKSKREDHPGKGQGKGLGGPGGDDDES